jgi:hypothetical protein
VVLIKTTVALLAACSGCIVHAVDKTTTATVSFVESEPTIGPPGAIAVEAHAVSSTIVVRAQRPRTCEREVFEITETTTTKEVEVDAPGLRDAPNIGPGAQDPISAGIAVIYLAGFAVMAVTGAVSGVATAIEMGVSGDKVVRSRRHLRTIRSACAISSPDLAVEIALSSGTRLKGSTNAEGLVSVEIPASEPSTGTATVIAGSSSFRINYDRAASTPSAVVPVLVTSTAEPTEEARELCIQKRQKLARQALTVTDARARQIELGRLPHC